MIGQIMNFKPVGTAVTAVPTVTAGPTGLDSIEINCPY